MMLNAGNGGGEGLALGANPCRLDTWGTVECCEVPPVTPCSGEETRN